jgi:hypothetical protein
MKTRPRFEERVYVAWVNAVGKATRSSAVEICIVKYSNQINWKSRGSFGRNRGLRKAVDPAFLAGIKSRSPTNNLTADQINSSNE